MMVEGFRGLTPEQEKDFVDNYSWRRALELMEKIRSPVSEKTVAYFEGKGKELLRRRDSLERLGKLVEKWRDRRLHEEDVRVVMEMISKRREELFERSMKIENLISYLGSSHEVQLDQIDEEIVRMISEKVERREEVTEPELAALEDILCKTSVLWNLSPEREEKIRAFILRTAKEDVVAGRFEDLTEALLHYGLEKEAEARDDQAVLREEAERS